MDGAQARQFSHGTELSATPFASEFVSLSRQEHVRLVWESRHYKRLHQGAVERIAQLEAEYRERLTLQAASAEQRERGLQGELEYAQRTHSLWNSGCLVARASIAGRSKINRSIAACRARARTSDVLQEFPGTEDSEVPEIEVKAYRRLIRRQRYRPVCRCGPLAGIVTAPATVACR